MRSILALSLVSLTALAACAPSGGVSFRDDERHAEVCQEQHDLAKLGKNPTGEIAISCPAHGIGYAYQ